MVKRLEGAGASRLSSGGDRSGAPKLRSLDHTRKRNKGFRMKPRDIARLEELVERVGEATGRRVAEAALIGGVLLLGERASVEELVEAVKESAWE